MNSIHFNATNLTEIRLNSFTSKSTQQYLVTNKSEVVYVPRAIIHSLKV